MRNPFRIALTTDEDGEYAFFVGDVGNRTWEEVSIARKGANLGWPCYEGEVAEPEFAVTPGSQELCAGLTADELTFPLVVYPNASNPIAIDSDYYGTAVVGGVVYTGKSFPPDYDGTYFFTDLTGGFLKAVKVDASGDLVSIEDFATGLASPVQVMVHPTTGDLYLVEIAGSQIIRISYTGEN
jgi:glucose/arabinose dehydrogenase